jgi:tripartite-type tricarboxylate transporter receptor subunit TctC
MPRAVLAALLLALGALGAPAQAQTPVWPSRPVRISVPVTAGSAIDLVAVRY